MHEKPSDPIATLDDDIAWWLEIAETALLMASPHKIHPDRLALVESKVRETAARASDAKRAAAAAKLTVAANQLAKLIAEIRRTELIWRGTYEFP